MGFLESFLCHCLPQPYVLYQHIGLVNYSQSQDRNDFSICFSLELSLLEASEAVTLSSLCHRVSLDNVVLGQPLGCAQPMADFSDEMADRVRKQESERFLMSFSLLLSLSVFDLFEHGCFFAS